MIESLKNIVRHLPSTETLISKFNGSQAEEVAVSGVSGSLNAFLVAVLHEQTNRTILALTRNAEASARMTDDLKLMLDPHTVFRLRRTKQKQPVISVGDPTRSEAIEVLRGLLEGAASVVVTDLTALTQVFPSVEDAKTLQSIVEVGKEQSFDGLLQLIRESGFERKDFIEEVGDYSVRGGIVDVFPFVGSNPVRIEFSGDTVESIREFDPSSQRSIQSLSVAHIVPDVFAMTGDSGLRGSLFDYLGDQAIVVIDEPILALSSIDAENGPEPEGQWTTDEVNDRILRCPRVNILLQADSSREVIDFRSFPQRPFNGSVKLFREYLAELHERGAKVFIACESQNELRRLKELLEAEDGAGGLPDVDPKHVTFIHHSPHEGFELGSAHTVLFTEHQLFMRRKKRGPETTRARRGLSVQDVQRLRKNDYVVHGDYGIGKFAGLQRIAVRGIDQEVLKILYQEGDVLYVNLHYVNRVQKYSSKEGHVPLINRLGSADWQKLKSRARKKLKDIARDLIRLYAHRRSADGFAFDADTTWQREMEASFVFEDTFDQAKATIEVKRDMELPHPMDRLICGDVGFGKTEIAVRASFKAVMGGKQVAILVPTTILALQHFNTFVDRLSKYPVRIEVLSRLKSGKDQEVIVRKIPAGEVDIVIGTHRLLSKDVVFKDLGLLVIDEEHRFGVGAKEKLRERRASVDTLTLTATPIPRTLHFSLMGARDLSLIATPPRNRIPILTELVEFNTDVIRDAIMREVGRGGQVYFVHDRVNDIEELTGRIREIVPGVGVRFAHGQMRPQDLERVMIEFLERKFDVLVCTKIIESGLDIPNVNTILIQRADHFGMAELYQLRGRVGRSNVQAYAYLIVPPLRNLPAETLRRLAAMKEFTELGSGFNVAMRDLEIRGAGNLLGSEQSGFIANMGFETYVRILEEAVRELKDEEFEGVFEKAQHVSTEGTIVEADVEALIPSDYIASDEERLGIYRRLYGVETREQILEVGEELADRFGPHPAQVKALIEILLLRLEGARYRIGRLKITKDHLDVEFPSDTVAGDEMLLEKFASGIASIRGRKVTMKEQGKVLIVRVGLGGEGELLPRALEAFHVITEKFPAGSTS